MRISDWSSDVCSSDLIEHLLAKVQRPVEARRVVIGELGIGNRFADAIDHAGDLFDVRLFGLDPDQVGAVLKAGDAVKNAAILASSGTKLIEVRGQTLRPQQLAIPVDEHITGDRKSTRRNSS